MFKAVEKNDKNVLIGLKITRSDANRPGERGDIRRAKIQKVDLDKMVRTLTIAEKNQAYSPRC